MWFKPGRSLTISLIDGTAITGRSLWAWPGRLRLCGVKTASGEVPGIVVIPSRSILIVQVQ
ncbi:MAG: hypothetical protein LKI34_02875 [Bifidobacterium tibiigranuli]|jgi:hypothetical protein|uniref:hypothetical protein n=1 Tax=Bifidobacterium tibiigranuli TaxID=2172043 RepID=UPI0026ED3A8B|nr:hypothetical protein [Bifidobacterium tibiigranuli]MCI1673150.1 hypothetical protein [Bifidobacterium tibiigranuli]MCI1713605.1 hypothetical protein [Bifidobacterium tibiigranuli]